LRAALPGGGGSGKVGDYFLLWKCTGKRVAQDPCLAVNDSELTVGRRPRQLSWVRITGFENPDLSLCFLIEHLDLSVISPVTSNPLGVTQADTCDQDYPERFTGEKLILPMFLPGSCDNSA
jgi:hypothetical protein